MKGLFCPSVKSFHSAPSLLEISELCILGLSWAIFLLWPRDHTIKAFIGRLMWSGGWCEDTDEDDEEDVEDVPVEGCLLNILPLLLFTTLLLLLFKNVFTWNCCKDIIEATVAIFRTSRFLNSSSDNRVSRWKSVNSMSFLHHKHGRNRELFFTFLFCVFLNKYRKKTNSR